MPAATMCYMKKNKKSAATWTDLVPANLYPGEAASWQKVDPKHFTWLNSADPTILGDMSEELVYYNNNKIQLSQAI